MDGLGFIREQLQIKWIGLQGILWSRVLPEIHQYASLDLYLNILVLYNDMALRASRDIIRDIKLDLLRLWLACSGIAVVWSDIAAQKVWREARSVDCIN